MHCITTLKNMGKFYGKIKIKQSYMLLSSDVHLSALTISRPRNDKTYLKTEKKLHVNLTSTMSYSIEAMTNCERAVIITINRRNYVKKAMLKWIEKVWGLLNILIPNQKIFKQKSMRVGVSKQAVYSCPRSSRVLCPFWSLE